MVRAGQIGERGVTPFQAASHPLVSSDKKSKSVPVPYDSVT